MFYVLGVSVGFYILYAIIALIAKHEIGLIIASILGVIVVIRYYIIRYNSRIFTCFFIVPFQVKSKKKDEWEPKIAKKIKGVQLWRKRT